MTPIHSEKRNLRRPDVENGGTDHEFLFILAFGQVSLLEIDSVIESMKLEASIEEADSSCVVIKTDFKRASSLFSRLGGSYKYARVIGHSISDSLDEISLPFRPKFNWTVSAYNCEPDLYDETHQSLHELLKVRGLGKAKFLEPKIRSSIEQQGNCLGAAELKATDVREKVLLEDRNDPGIDLVVHGGINQSQPIFAQTIDTFDSVEFKGRDVDRPFQNPTKTLAPRTARAIVNIALSVESHSLLDPFCGLGTILQEALLCNVSIIGVDKNQDDVEKARANLDWLISKYKVSQHLHENIFAYDARRISHARLPRIDAIASEPILLPIFKQNPNVLESIALIEKVRSTYEECLDEFSSILSKPGSRIALVSPLLIDSSGKRRSFDLKDAAEHAGLKPYKGSKKLANRVSDHLSFEGQKKRTIQRNLVVYYLS